MERFYITTSIVYTNAPPHIGFALEMVQADAIARWRRMLGDDVRFLTGTDEHGIKNLRAAESAGLPVQEFVDGIAAKVSRLGERLNISNTGFARTSDRQRHWPAAQKLWERLAASGDLYKKVYEGLYCVGHEAFIKESELKDGLCPLHGTKPEQISEENWFFRLSSYRDRVRHLLESGGLRIVPGTRLNEVLNLLDDAEDVSFSRPAERLPWGIPVPQDPTQTMYVWADALTNYLSGLGFGTDDADMAFWPADVHLVGKDIVRFHAIIWPAMLLSAGLKTPKSVFVHGFITVDGQKMSKTVGNVVDPSDVLDQWPADVVRYFMLRELQSTDDGDFSWKNLEIRYETDLANGLGNLVQRVAVLASRLDAPLAYDAALIESDIAGNLEACDEGYDRAFGEFRLHDAASKLWELVAATNAYINLQEPWKQEGERLRTTLLNGIAMLQHASWLLQPFMPDIARRISGVIGADLTARIADGHRFDVAVPKPLFPRRP